MRNLILDFLRRNWWVLLFASFYCMLMATADHQLMGLMMGGILFAGAATIDFVIRNLRNFSSLPIPRQEIRRAYWIVSVLLPAIWLGTASVATSWVVSLITVEPETVNVGLMVINVSLLIMGVTLPYVAAILSGGDARSRFAIAAAWTPALFVMVIFRVELFGEVQLGSPWVYSSVALLMAWGSYFVRPVSSHRLAKSTASASDSPAAMTTGFFDGTSVHILRMLRQLGILVIAALAFDFVNQATILRMLPAEMFKSSFNTGLLIVVASLFIVITAEKIDLRALKTLPLSTIRLTGFMLLQPLLVGLVLSTLWISLAAPMENQAMKFLETTWFLVGFCAFGTWVGMRWMPALLPSLSIFGMLAFQMYPWTAVLWIVAGVLALPVSALLIYQALRRSPNIYRIRTWLNPTGQTAAHGL